MHTFNFSTMFGRYKVANRIHLLSALGVFSVIALMSTYWFGETKVNAAIDMEVQGVKLLQLSRQVEVGALQIRRREKDFFLRLDKKYLDKYRADHASVSSALSKMQNLEIASQISGEVQRLKTGTDLHSAHFAKIVELYEKLGFNENLGLQGKLRAAVHAVEKKLGEYNADKLTVKMLMMRRHEKDFMLRAKEKYIVRIDERRAEFSALMKASDIPVAEQKEITALLDDYHSRFKAYANASLELNQEKPVLSKIYAEMAPDFARLFVVAAEIAETSEAHLHAATTQTETIFLIVSVIMLILMIILGFIIPLSIIQPLRDISAASKKIASEENETEVPCLEQHNAIGRLAQTIQIFKDNNLERHRLREEAEAEQKIRTRRQERIEELVHDFRSTSSDVLGNVIKTAGGMETTAANLTSKSEETTSQASNVAAAAEQSSTNVQAVATAAEELTASINEITRQIETTSGIVEQAVSAALETDSKVANLAESATKIGEVVSLIQGIAEQTNLLALNATIEAARAGEAGKGFAVVASEVKELATQTSKATEAISEQITAIQTETQTAVGSIREIAETMEKVGTATDSIAEAAKQQSSATVEISSNVQQAAAGSTEVSSNIVGVTNTASDNLKSSNEVLGAAEHVSSSAADLQSVVDHFLTEVEAA
ncbi:MAG: methyl-accepting chemotaxis protein [Roseibium sp.]